MTETAFRALLDRVALIEYLLKIETAMYRPLIRRGCATRAGSVTDTKQRNTAAKGDLDMNAMNAERTCSNCGIDYSPNLTRGGRMPKGYRVCPNCGGTKTTEFISKLYECGCCGSFHRKGFTGDCRNDDGRFPTGLHLLEGRE